MKIINPLKSFLALLLLFSPLCIAGYWSTITTTGDKSDYKYYNPEGQIFTAMLNDIENNGIEFSSYKIEVRVYDFETAYIGAEGSFAELLLVVSTRFEISLSFEFDTQAEQTQFDSFITANLWSTGTVGFWLDGIDFGQPWDIDGASTLISESGASSLIWDNLFNTNVSRDAMGIPILDANNDYILLDTTHHNDYFWHTDWQFELEPNFDMNHIWNTLNIFNLMTINNSTTGIVALQFPQPPEIDDDFPPYVINSFNDPRNLIPSEIRWNMQVEMNAANLGNHDVQFDIYYYYDNQSAALALDQYMLDEPHINNHVGEQNTVDYYSQVPLLSDYPNYTSLHNSVGSGHLSTNNVNDRFPAQMFAGSALFSNNIIPVGLNFETAASTSYTLGGTVSGLGAGASLTIQNNATDDEVVIIDGAFTFDAPIPNGFSYEVTVLTQPTQTNHICLVSGGNSGNDDGTGTITDANDASIIVTCTFICETQDTGAWSDANTWQNCNNSIPQTGHSVVINDTHTVTLNQDTALLESLVVNVGGDLNVSGNYSLLADADGADFDLQNASIELLGDLTIDANAHNLLLGDVDGGFGLTINNSTETRFLGKIGVTTALSSLLTDSFGTTVFADTSGTGIIANIIVDGAIEFNDPILITDTTNISGATESIIFNSTIDGELGNGKLRVTGVQNANISFNGDVGSNTRLASLQVQNVVSSIVHLNAENFLTTGNQRWRSHVVLIAPSVNFSSSANLKIIIGDNNSHYLRSEVAGQSELTIQNVSGEAVINSTIGDNNQQLANFSITYAASINLNSSSITVDDSITFAAPVLMTAALVLNADIIDVQSDVDNAGFDLTFNTSDVNEITNITGVLSGTGSFIKTGLGDMSFSSINTLSGNVSFDQGDIENLNTSNAIFPNAGIISIASGVDAKVGGSASFIFELANNQTLIGDGICRCNVESENGANISPGFSTGSLSTSNLKMNTGSTLSIELNGTVVGSQYDQITSSTGVNLNADSLAGSILDLSVGFNPNINDSFTIVDLAGPIPILGTFDGLPEGSIFVVQDQLFSITYEGGNGNDVLITALGDPILFVDANAALGGDGQSWATAFDNLQDALAVAILGMEIWVAQGVYYPDVGATQISDDRLANFTLIDGVSIYGGFNGTETEINLRDPKANTTVLSGDIDGNDINDDGNNIAETVNDINGDNSYNILIGSNVDTNTLLDGFTVTAGKATSVDTVNKRGAGIYCGNNTSGPSLNQMTFIANLADDRGAATFGCSQYVTNSSFINQYSDDLAGAVLAIGGYYENIIFEGNEARRTGGAMRNTGNPLTMKNIKFIANKSRVEDGGGLYSTADVTMENILFSGNQAGTNSGDEGGGLYLLNNIVADLTNVTFTGNKAGGLGGAISMTDTTILNINNTIIWNNLDSTGNNTITSSINVPIGAIVTNSNSLIQAFGTTGVGNLDEDPLFVTDTDPTTAPTIDGNARINVGSPVIAQGNDAFVNELLDLDGNTRIVDTVEMGAYEFASSGVFVDVSGLLGTLVLQNSGGNDLLINANGGHVFSVEVARSDSYDVSIFSQSTTVNQNCVLSNSSGLVANNPIIEVALDCTTLKYNIGVDVTGLANGNTLELENNGEDLTITSNGQFDFPIALNDGSNYDVVVASQPTTPNQICSVIAGSGNLNGADVLLTVTCTTTQYNIGVDVSGLANGNSVVLDNNGESLTANIDGQYNFATALDDGSAYSVTVTTQPQMPNQVCSVVSGSGNLEGASVLITVACTTNQYLVGGMASGLASGNSVTLSLGVEDLIVNSNAAFVFVNPLTDESNYSVSVSSQPTSPNQSCDLVNATGTITGDDVIDVEVNCTTNQYSIGGTVAGLHSGNNLVLQNNGGDDLNIANSGDFDFVTAIDDLQSYNVIILNQASNPIQPCVINNNTGNVAGSPVTTVSIVCDFGDDLIYRGGFE